MNPIDYLLVELLFFRIYGKGISVRGVCDKIVIVGCGQTRGIATIIFTCISGLNVDFFN